MVPIKDRIIQIVTPSTGIRASFLCASLSCEYLTMVKRDIRLAIFELVEAGEIVELEYTLPNYQNESLILPKGSVFRGVSSIDKGIQD